MKITDSEIIKSGERELIDTITADLDWDSIEKIVKDHHKLNIQDDVEYKKGDIIVHDNKVAYRLDFEVKMSLSVVFDRDGNCLSMATADEVVETPTDSLPAEETAMPASPPTPDEITSDRANATEDEPSSELTDTAGDETALELTDTLEDETAPSFDDAIPEENAPTPPEAAGDETALELTDTLEDETAPSFDDAIPEENAPTPPEAAGDETALELTDTLEDESTKTTPTRDPAPGIDSDKQPKENMSQMASHIAEMISEINEE